MVRLALKAIALGFWLLGREAAAQFPSTINDSSATTITSPADEAVTIVYRSPLPGTCTTIFDTQKQYTGYVNLPPGTLLPIQQNYSIHTFFWFIEARESPETAPLTIWINGGPGASSMVGLFQEVGPCEAVELARGQFGTRARDWGWDRSSNIVFIDQPNMVGFSYDTLTNGTLDLFNGAASVPPVQAPTSQSFPTYLNGTFSSNSTSSTANTSHIAAVSTWHMLQGFLAAFPQYNPDLITDSDAESSNIGVNLFAESYGGKYGPDFANYWEEQNEKRNNGSLPADTTLEIRLRSIGIMQGCIDDIVQGKYYPLFAYNNSYGIQAISQLAEVNAASAYLAADGCQAQIQACRDAAASQDPQDNGNLDSVNELCLTAQNTCNNDVFNIFLQSGLSVYDISQESLNPFPPLTYLEYLNTAAVQSSIGVSLNYTEENGAVAAAFQNTGDYERGTQLSQLASLLDRGIRVALVYGDRDYACNWLGGEAASFSIAANAPSHSGFYASGYSPIIVNSTYIGGAVRQYGNLSFSRIYDAGHLIAAYQAETAFQVFSRIILGTDISTGEAVDLTVFATTGDANATATNSAPAAASPTCYLRAIGSTCSQEQIDAINSGSGTIINGVLYEKESDWKSPASSMTANAGTPTSSVSSTTTTYNTSTREGNPSSAQTTSYATGVYVATATPTMSTGTSIKKQEIHSLFRIMASIPFLVFLISG